MLFAGQPISHWFFPEEIDNFNKLGLNIDFKILVFSEIQYNDNYDRLECIHMKKKYKFKINKLTKQWSVNY